MDKKVELRKAFTAKRSSMTREDNNKKSELICQRLLNSKAYKESKIIMAYLSIGKEVSLDRFIDRAISDEKDIYVPYCTKEKGIMKAIRLESLAKTQNGKMGIRVPNDCQAEFELNEFDMVLIPGLAFDALGGRLGMGGGYYDRFLDKYDCKHYIGIAFDYQISETPLPMEVHDYKMGSVLTETGIIRCKKV